MTLPLQMEHLYNQSLKYVSFGISTYSVYGNGRKHVIDWYELLHPVGARKRCIIPMTTCINPYRLMFMEGKPWQDPSMIRCLHFYMVFLLSTRSRSPLGKMSMFTEGDKCELYNYLNCNCHKNMKSKLALHVKTWCWKLSEVNDMFCTLRGQPGVQQNYGATWTILHLLAPILAMANQ